MPGLVAAGPALAGQGLNLAALVIPIVLGRVHQIAFSVTVVALGGITVFVCILSFHNVYPSLARESDARKAMSLSLILLVGTTLATALVFAFVPGLPASIRTYGIWTAASAFGQGLYMMATAVQIRAQLYSVISRARLWYGLTNVVLTTAACLSERRAALSAATSAAFVVAVGVMVAMDGDFWSHRFRGGRPSLRWSIDYMRSHARSALSGVVSSAAIQAGALAVPGLSGSVQSVWAVALRFGGGFGTVARYVVSPMFEIDIASGTRFGDAARARRANNKAIRLGLGLGCIAALGVLASVTLAALRSPGATNYPAVAVSVVFIVAWLVPLVAINNLVLMRRPQDFLLWTLAKAAALIAAVALFRGFRMLVVFTLIEITMNTIYVALVRARLSQAERTWVRRPSPGAPRPRVQLGD